MYCKSLWIKVSAKCINYPLYLHLADTFIQRNQHGIEVIYLSVHVRGVYHALPFDLQDNIQKVLFHTTSVLK